MIEIDDHDALSLWQVNIAPTHTDMLKNVTEEIIKNEFEGVKMIPSYKLMRYFPNIQKNEEDDDDGNIHVFVIIRTGKHLPMFYLSNKNVIHNLLIAVVF